MNLRNITTTNNAKIIQKEIDDLDLTYKSLKLKFEEIKYDKYKQADADYDKSLTELNNKRTSELQEIQSKCSHKMIEDGRDSHKTYYTCKICGYND